jgi:hypothetical protein
MPEDGVWQRLDLLHDGVHLSLAVRNVSDSYCVPSKYAFLDITLSSLL